MNLPQDDTQMRAPVQQRIDTPLRRRTFSLPSQEMTAPGQALNVPGHRATSRISLSPAARQLAQLSLGISFLGCLIGVTEARDKLIFTDGNGYYGEISNQKNCCRNVDYEGAVNQIRSAFVALGASLTPVQSLPTKIFLGDAGCGSFKTNEVASNLTATITTNLRKVAYC